MRMTVGRLRTMIRESLGGSHPEESYNAELLDDPAFDTDSVYVPNWTKKKIKTWAKKMGLSS